jgi:type II secretory pathway pseudopilin PulG
MIELLFVIVILGIVGGFALEAIRNYYDGIYRTGEYTKRVAQADHILEQLSKYFENAISVSIVNLDREGDALGCYGPPAGNDANDYTVAFVAVDGDALRGLWNGSRWQSGWSEDVLVNDNNITATDASYTVANSIITALGSTLLDSAVYNSDSIDVNACARFNWDDAGGTTGFHTISDWNVTTLALATTPAHGKRKYLLRTGYAFRVKQNGNFTMYSNFRPWKTAPAERYNTYANRKETLLGKKVAHFYADYNATDFADDENVTDRGLVWRLKVCMRGLDANLSDSDDPKNDICRERRVHVRY